MVTSTHSALGKINVFNGEDTIERPEEAEQRKQQSILRQAHKAFFSGVEAGGRRVVQIGTKMVSVDASPQLGVAQVARAMA